MMDPTDFSPLHAFGIQNSVYKEAHYCLSSVAELSSLVGELHNS